MTEQLPESPDQLPVGPTNAQPAPPAQAGATTQKLPWNPIWAIVYGLGTFAIASQLIVPFALYGLLLFKGETSAQAVDMLQNNITAQFVYVLLAEGLTILAIWWFARMHHRTLRVIGWRGVRLMDPVVTVLAFIVYFLVYGALLLTLMHFVPSLNVDQKQNLGFNNATGTGNLLLTFVSLAVLPPLAEEMLFRGLIFTSLRSRLRWIWSALITSLLFASLHLQFGSGAPLLWVAGLDTFTLSMVLCYIRDRTDSLWPGIFLHALKNTIAFASLYIFVSH